MTLPDTLFVWIQVNHNLIHNGVEDTSVPIEIQKKFVNRMRPLYTNNQDKLQLIEFSNVNHRVTTSIEVVHYQRFGEALRIVKEYMQCKKIF